ncbi:MAG TPA: FAD-binding oxidoreductase [Anaerolineaceae bacterium]|nr:FAD-binding oxidoreductase [Anaerolineaceae bacterium]HPN51673.1 FAD-binding oxidoreductase [Anaerolineaceae bacterium]
MNNASQNFDVIIIGAGSVGAPTAFYMAQAGLKTLVIDQYASVGQGANKKAIGGIRATHSDPAKISLCQRSIEIFSTWHEQYGDDIEWQKGGYSFVSYRDQETKTLKDLLIIQKSLGLNIDWYDKNQFLEIIPDLNPINLQGGTFSPDDGSASPLLAVHAFYKHAARLGAQFAYNEKVIAFERDGEKISAVITDKHRYSAPVVINAAGPWARPVGQLLGMDLPVNPDSHEGGITEAVEPFLRPMVVDIQPAPGSSNYYFYQHSTGQIVFCITPSPNIWGFDEEETSKFLPMVAKRMVNLMPRLKNIRVRRTWRGLYPMTPDGAPLLGWSKEIPGHLLAVGMCGQGFMLGPGIGELLVKIVQDQMSENDKMILQKLSPYRQFGGQEKLK